MTPIIITHNIPNSINPKQDIIKINVVDSTPGDIGGCYANIKKINKLLLFSPKIKFREGIKLFKNWADSL